MWNVNNEEKRMRSRKLQAAQLQADRALEPMSTRADVAASFRALLLARLSSAAWLP